MRVGFPSSGARATRSSVRFRPIRRPMRKERWIASTIPTRYSAATSGSYAIRASSFSFRSPPSEGEVVGGTVHVKRDPLVVEKGETQTGSACGRATFRQALVPSEASFDGGRRRDGECLGVWSQAIWRPNESAVG